MTRLDWDKVGERVFETGVDRGVLYVPDNGVYTSGVAWNGLTTVTEKPSGADSNPFYADNIKYLNLTAAEEFGATIEAFTYPKEFAQFDGSVVLSGGVSLGQQSRRTFGLSYRTRVGNDVEGSDLGYKLHLIYGCQAAPSERAYATVNDKPEALSFSWDLTTSPVTVTGQKPTALVTIDSTRVTSGALTTLENVLWGSPGNDPRLPLPDEIIGIFAGSLTAVTAGSITAPTYTSGTRTVAIPTVTGVVYTVNGVVRTTNYIIPIGEYAVVQASPAAGYSFPTTPITDRWVFGPAS